MYSSSVSDHQGDIGVRDAIEPVLSRYAKRVVAYVAGHEHALMHMQPYGRDEGYDQFVSGAGSRLRAIKTPNTTRSEYWRSCCNVLALSENASVPRSVWSSSVNGFFVYKIEGDMFSAIAYDKDGRVMHQHERVLPAV